MNDGVFGWSIGLVCGLVLAFGFDNYHFRPSWEEAAKKQERLKTYTTIAQMGYGEYRLDRNTGYSEFAWFSAREYLKNNYPRLTDNDIEWLLNPYREIMK